MPFTLDLEYSEIRIDPAFQFQPGMTYKFVNQLPGPFTTSISMQNTYHNTVSSSIGRFSGQELVLRNISPGWYANGDGVTNGVVASVDAINQRVTLASPNQFQPLKYYTFTQPPSFACFGKGVKILCEDDKYVPVEDLKKGDVVKTYLQGNRKINYIGKKRIRNNVSNWKSSLFAYKNDPEVLLTGMHCAFFDTECENCHAKILDKYSVFAGKSKDFVQVQNEEEYDIYHFSLENDGKIGRVFIVWANDLLVETTSEKEFLTGFFSDCCM